MATPIKILISSILQIVSDLRGESSTNTDAARVRAVSRAEKYYAGYGDRYWKIHLLKDQEIAGADTGDYTIGSATYPMREKGLVEVFVGGTAESQRYTVVDFGAYKNLVNRNSSERLAYEYYDAANDAWKVHINPEVATGTTIYYSYYWHPPDRTASTEYVYCTNPLIIVKRTMGDIYEGEEEPQQANLVRNEAEQLITQAMGVEDMPAKGQIYAMGAIENQTRSRGLGSY